MVFFLLDSHGNIAFSFLKFPKWAFTIMRFNWILLLDKWNCRINHIDDPCNYVLQRCTLTNAHSHSSNVYTFIIHSVYYVYCTRNAMFAPVYLVITNHFFQKEQINIYTRSTFTSSLTILFEFETEKKEKNKWATVYLFSFLFAHNKMFTICWMLLHWLIWRSCLRHMEIVLCVCRIYPSVG